MKQAGADSPEGKTSGDKLSGSAMLKAVGVGLALIAVAALLAETVLLPLQGAKRFLSASRPRSRVLRPYSMIRRKWLHVDFPDSLGA